MSELHVCVCACVCVCMCVYVCVCGREIERERGRTRPLYTAAGVRARRERQSGISKHYRSTSLIRKRPPPYGPFWALGMVVL